MTKLKTILTSAAVAFSLTLTGSIASAGPLAKFNKSELATVATMIAIHEEKCDEPTPAAAKAVLLLIMAEPKMDKKAAKAAISWHADLISKAGMDGWCSVATDAIDRMIAAMD